MSINNKILAKDGKWYDTITEANTASLAWEEKQNIQKEQNRLIQEQNKLIQEQEELELQRFQNEKELKSREIEQNEEKRMKALFDKIGMSYNVFYDYFQKNFENDINNIEEILEEKEREINFLNYWLANYNEPKEVITSFDSSYITSSLYYEIVYSCDKNSIKSGFNKFISENIDKFREFIIGYSTLMFIAFLVFIMLLPADTDGVLIAPFIILVIIYAIILIVFVLFYVKTESLNKISVDDDLCKSKIKKELHIIKKDYAELKKELISQKSNIETNKHDFDKFRLEHYNKDMEKILIDSGYKELIEDAGFKYQIVNINNKKKNGTIEDYTAYFEEHL